MEHSNDDRDALVDEYIDRMVERQTDGLQPVPFELFLVNRKAYRLMKVPP